jgi:hypothetical protein
VPPAVSLCKNGARRYLLRTKSVRATAQIHDYFSPTAYKSSYPVENQSFFGFGLLYAKFHLRTQLMVLA